MSANDHPHFVELRERGMTAQQACEHARTRGLSAIERIGLLRTVYELSFREAKEVLLFDQGTAPSLEEHEARLASALQSAGDDELAKLLGE
ncbi:MAG: hypothetical protein AAGA54_32720 [Myxococcota bacterium]